MARWNAALHPRGRGGKFKKKGGGSSGSVSQKELNRRAEISYSRQTGDLKPRSKKEQARQRSNGRKIAAGAVGGAVVGFVAGARVSKGSPAVAVVSGYVGAHAGAKAVSDRLQAKRATQGRKVKR